jgi:hypothetical protein
MSKSLAIAATTATLRNLLLKGVPKADSGLPQGFEVKTLPPDVAATKITGDNPALNLFLYQTQLNAAWRNQDMPLGTRPGETAMPPLALNLHYLMTAYGTDDSELGTISHRVLGAAMSVLHDHPVLGRSEIKDALTDNDLGEQFERIRITPLATSVEDLSKLWMIFQTQYRISAAYEVTVLLIDSRLPVKAPLPVLRRGEQDRGATAVAGTAATLTGVRPPRSQSAARLGDDVIFTVENFSGDANLLRFTHQRSDVVHEYPVSAAPSGELAFHLPSTAEDPAAMHIWTPGYYAVSLVQKRAGLPTTISNEIPFGLAPRITVAPVAAKAGTINLKLSCEPRILDDQRVLVLFGSGQFSPGPVTSPADDTKPTSITADVSESVVGDYVVRLRVDGVDSIPVVVTGTPPLPSFDPAQKVKVTAP